MRSIDSAITEKILTGSKTAETSSSIRESSSKSSMVLAIRFASFTIFDDNRWMTFRSSSSRMVSANIDNAPTGVFNSWLMFATKSVRTASMRVRSEISSIIAMDFKPSRGRASTTRVRGGGPNSSRVSRTVEPNSRDFLMMRSAASLTNTSMCREISTPATT